MFESIMCNRFSFFAYPGCLQGCLTRQRILFRLRFITNSVYLKEHS